MLNTTNACFGVIKWLTQELGRDPTIAEIASYMHMPESKIRDIVSLFEDVVSLDSPLDDEYSGTVIDNIADDTDDFQELITQDLSARIRSMLSALSARESLIITCRYGLSGKAPLTLDATGQLLGLTRERVRQIQLRAIEKLRDNERLADIHKLIS
jgi:RNA polymerase primary sigma factor